MKFITAFYLFPLFPALVFSTRQGYEELERQLKEVFKERSNILRQLSKTSRELDGIKVNLQSLKNDEASAKSDVQKLLELGKKQREEMKSLQEAFQKQLNEAAEKAEKQQATINFLKTEMERKSKMIRDLQNESKKIQAQLKELRYGKKDLIFKAQQLTDLEQKLAVAKDELEKAALDKESQLKALKETVQLCLTSVLRNQPPAMSLISSKVTERRLPPPSTNDSKVPVAVTGKKAQPTVLGDKRSLQVESPKEEKPSTNCDSPDGGKICVVNHNSTNVNNKTTELDPVFQKLYTPPQTKLEIPKSEDNNQKTSKGIANTEEKTL
ncbi:leucine zipper protein 2 isoform X2 [Dromiciops gliroides]|uniref:leucine zipper protein 2 isoform X2 n=1 Tax=Dromiciops gliroides TaxID=33562 RepID=UPI001CC5A353|nr:leucine zipper protein 2 isoform X2 [Dromiciops gliroides]